MSQPFLLLYLPYAAIALVLVIWLARTLSRHGEVFLATVFPNDAKLAHAVNQLLVIGFYLVNLGAALLLLRVDAYEIVNERAAVEVLATKLGTLLLLLGAAHLANLYVFHRVRRGASAPAGRLSERR
jgi:hypothetical protein